MKIQLLSRSPCLETEVLILPVFEAQQVDSSESIVSQFLKENPKFGKNYEIQLLYGAKQKVLLVGAGKKEKFNFEIAQNWAGAAAKYLLSRAKEATFILPQLENLTFEQLIQATIFGVEIAGHDPSLAYKSEKQPVKLNNLRIIVERAQKSYHDSLKEAMVIAEGITLARRLGDMPANEMTPGYFLGVARKIAKENKLKITAINEAQAKKLGMGGFAGVAHGSDEPSYLIVLEYTGNPRSKEKWGLMGKGITFDSGGISIKPNSGMQEMKYDMCGAANVLGMIQAIARLKPKVNVAGIMAVTENMPSGKALKPGDIIRTYSRKTVEIFSTDAEGRLVLADALTYVQKNLKATKLVDLATLTMAMIISLGNFRTGAFSNNQEFVMSLMQGGEKAGERYWAFPMDEEYGEMLKSEMADMANLGQGGSAPGAAGSITAAKFLQKFIEDKRPWVHLDIAGTAWDMKPKPYRGSGATGVGIKTLVKLILKGDKA